METRLWGRRYGRVVSLRPDAKSRGCALTFQDAQREQFPALKVGEKQLGASEGSFLGGARRGRTPGGGGGTRAAGSARRRCPPAPRWARAAPARPGAAGPWGETELRPQVKAAQTCPGDSPLPLVRGFLVFFFFNCPLPFSSCSTEMKSCQGNLPAESHARMGPLGAWSTLLGPKHIDNSA